MVKLVVAYGAPQDPAAFEQHYASTHTPIVHKIPNLQRFEAGKVLGTPDGSPSRTSGSPNCRSTTSPRSKRRWRAPRSSGRRRCAELGLGRRDPDDRRGLTAPRIGRIQGGARHQLPDHSRLSRSGMGTSFVGFHQASGRSYRVATFGGADGHVAIVISAGFGTTTIDASLRRSALLGVSDRGGGRCRGAGGGVVVGVPRAR